MFLFQDFRVMQLSLNASPTPCKSSETFFWIKLGLKTKISIYDISRILFYNMDFDFAHFANFNFAHFEIEKSFGLIWVNCKMVDLTGKFPFPVFIRFSFQVWA